ncbi:MAG: Translation initiation factor IF-1 [Candidatus Levybacteria bacterium GW2011_GWB1_39_7]|nr:MAG: Translation initiation factor IF-1 [Candidatus Levybacteria bacterium GW2011_GWB1_39_7]
MNYRGDMAHEGAIEIEGIVKEVLPNTLFRVEIEGGKVILCHLSGKMRIHFIKILPGDKVRIEMTPYDRERGRITYRIK